MNVSWSRRAATQLFAAVDFLENERRGAGKSLSDLVRAAIDTISKYPRISPCVPGVVGGEVRRALIRRYGYWLIYEVRSEEIVVLALWHVRRLPFRSGT